ncbi:YifB family Mg chelatase-like AAA ATPase [Butyricicoccus sp.]|uniref:YifB family Mg chelatase-like AAA ATPase n=1 Tax=Butyricicoccus sp. TaxID=2049021 RepID=UPI003F18CB96
MIATAFSAGIYGIEGYLVTVECGIANGLPAFDIVGLPGAAVREAKERVTTAARSMGLAVPPCRKTVNLAPADRKKEGAVYDLPVFLGLMAALGQTGPLPEDCVFIGEMSLSGGLRPVRGALSMAMAVRDSGKTCLFVPEENAEEAALAGGLTIYAAKHAQEILDHLSGKKRMQAYTGKPAKPSELLGNPDFCDVMGQENVKRAMEIAAAGGHNMLLCGTPGSGKSMMAKRIGTILPPMTPEEKLDVVRIYSVIGEGAEAARSDLRPIRSPHHTTSAAGIAGGGTGIPVPGELSLAHNGVLFLDELPEFRKDALEVLRQPLEDGTVSIVRTAGRVTYPAKFMLICAMNPCKCGWYGHPSGRCRCTPYEVREYRKKISGPLLDRIDIQMDVRPVPLRDLSERRPAEHSADIRARVVAARERQLERYRGTGVTCNADMRPAQLAEFCRPDEAGQKLMDSAFERLGMTARSYDRVLRLARTIADLAGEERISAAHIAEAIQYRFR